MAKLYLIGNAHLDPVWLWRWKEGFAEILATYRSALERMKDVDDALFETTAVVVQRMCKEYGATFIINDNVALAKKIGADGVHLGKTDMSIAEARKMLGEYSIIGATVNSYEDILYHLQGVVPDYFGCGPFRYTSTKNNLAPVLGENGYREILRMMCDGNVDIPLVAIGGIVKEDIPHLLECGVHGIALSGSVLNADDPVKEMNEIVNLIL